MADGRAVVLAAGHDKSFQGLTRCESHGVSCESARCTGRQPSPPQSSRRSEMTTAAGDVVTTCAVGAELVRQRQHFAFQDAGPALSVRTPSVARAFAMTGGTGTVPAVVDMRGDGSPLVLAPVPVLPSIQHQRKANSHGRRHHDHR